MHTVLNLLGKDYRATDMQPGYAAMRDALQADLPLLEAIRIEVDEKRFQERSRSGFRGTATAGTKSHSPRLRHGAIVRN